MVDRYIDQLNKVYKKIVDDPAYGSRVLDEANDVVCDALKKLEDIAKTKRNG